MPRRHRVLAFLVPLCILIASPLAAQPAGEVTWRMAFLKGSVHDQAAQDLTKPIELKHGDEFQIFLQVVKPQAYVYAFFRGADGSILPLAADRFSEGDAVILPAERKTFTVTPPSGQEIIYVLVSASRQTALERLLSRKKRDAEAIVEEVKRVQLSASSVAEAPQKPVPIGGVVRGGKDDWRASEFEGRNTYVQILRLDH